MEKVKLEMTKEEQCLLVKDIISKHTDEIICRLINNGFVCEEMLEYDDCFVLSYLANRGYFLEKLIDHNDEEVRLNVFQFLCNQQKITKEEIKKELKNNSFKTSLYLYEYLFNNKLLSQDFIELAIENDNECVLLFLIKNKVINESMLKSKHLKVLEALSKEGYLKEKDLFSNIFVDILKDEIKILQNNISLNDFDTDYTNEKVEDLFFDCVGNDKYFQGDLYELIYDTSSGFVDIYNYNLLNSLPKYVEELEECIKEYPVNNQVSIYDLLKLSQERSYSSVLFNNMKELCYYFACNHFIQWIDKNSDYIKQLNKQISNEEIYNILDNLDDFIENELVTIYETNNYQIEDFADEEIEKFLIDIDGTNDCIFNTYQKIKEDLNKQ